MRNEAWRRRFAMEAQFGGPAGPWAPRALASLYRAGKSPGVITQNIDNLHQAPELPPNVIELHGNTTYALCLDCAKRYELAWVRSGSSRPASARPTARLRRPHQDRDDLVRSGDAGGGDARAEQLTLDCDLFLGSAPRWWCGRLRVSRCWPSETARAGDHQSRGDRIRRDRRPGRARRHRNGACSLHHPLIRGSPSKMRSPSTSFGKPAFCPFPNAAE